MGMFDLPAPIFSAIDGVLAMAMPALLRLVLWGVLAGWLSMVLYRVLSDQNKIGELKTQQKEQQKLITEFDGEFAQLMPLIRSALALGFRQLGLALGPALLATVPVLFIIIWVSGEYGYTTPAAGEEVFMSAEPAAGNSLQWSASGEVKVTKDGWLINWPSKEQSLTLSDDQQALLVLPLEHDIPIIHKKKWWNSLMANPIGYLPKDGKTDVIHIHLPEAVIIASGPGWIRGWMFSFFMSFLLSSVGFKLFLRLD
jgi:hypothetical protein